jgi:hypothetical protein
MSVTKLPETVLEALGQDAAEDLTAWFEERLSRAGLLPGVQISPFVARQKVNVLVLERVSNLLLANDPQLVQVTEDEYVWRVPVDLTYPERGRVGCVGELDVDARYGQIRYDEAVLADFAARARQIAEDMMSSST